ncbi:MAG TPA: PEP-CTERM system histidine kinase PrsK [Deltaproteobacteria bacterium]|nr:PEP-CTERM system histidine kinase PrsK [Deltaproteobacteria bacterium]HOI05509.1 PEP-CTERM system histidine kinase PrsK [Deltaproteobacteria bacterium]
MELLIFSLTALISFLGGTVILTRSRARYGRTVAAGLLFLSLMEAFYGVFLITGSLTSLTAASFFEVACTAAILLSVTSMEANLAKNALLLRRERSLLILGCALYGLLAALFPGGVLVAGEEGDILLGWIMKVQSMGVLFNAVAFMWIMENIMRSSTEGQKRIMKYPALGIIALGAAFVLMTVDRLSTVRVSQDMLLLCTLIYLVGISFVIFFSIRFKLFEMDIFVSRYVVYHSATLLIIGAYLIVMGLLILGVQRLGLELPYVWTGFLLFVVLFALAFLIVSKEAKARLRFFINTHFFANKYDYRREWGELSGYLSIAFNEKQIIHVTAQVIFDSMYISELGIWIKDGPAFRCAYGIPASLMNERIDEGEPLIRYLERNPYFLRKTPRTPGDGLWETIVRDRSKFLDTKRIELAASMMVENRLIGFIAVGRENPGTPYGQDDIDLLTAIASQSSAALMSARFAQELAANKELDTFNRMSSYVLHDLKNAAGNLSLILQNAPNHMDNEEFRTDMLETISQTLDRIGKVMARLGAMPGRGDMAREEVRLAGLVEGLLAKLSPRLQGIAVARAIEEDLSVVTDPDMLERAIENIIINATEAVRQDGRISISAHRDDGRVYIAVQDNGSGMTQEFIRDRLFKPFQTTKENGTGIGLWQVRNIVDGLGGTVEVKSSLAEGTCFTVALPA